MRLVDNLKIMNFYHSNCCKVKTRRRCVPITVQLFPPVKRFYKKYPLTNSFAICFSECNICFSTFTISVKAGFSF